MPDALVVEWVREKYEVLRPSLNERAREKQPGLTEALKGLVDPTSRGDPELPLRWTCKSTRHLADELRRQGFLVGPRTVAKELAEQGFSLQANRKTPEGKQHPDRNAQFEYIMFCHITQNWRGRPLTSYAVIVQLIGNTKTTTGLQIRAELDEHTYPAKERVTPAQLANVRLKPAVFHGEWNYAITPH